MTHILQEAIKAVKENQYSFCKFVSANDAGDTGAHQAGLYIPKNSSKLLFDEQGAKGEMKERLVTMQWPFDNVITTSRFIYYGKETRNEYRITRLGRKFNEGDLVIISKEDENNYVGYQLADSNDIKAFLEEFNLNKEDTNSLIDKQRNTSELSFKPRAHILILLGEELIKSPVMAIYELIKNSYDADATVVDVSFLNVHIPTSTSIMLKDNGIGITEEILKNVWFEPGTDFRKPINEDGLRVINRTKIYERIPMGEKGVGRFAVHKLGNKIKVVTRPCKVITDEKGKFIRTQLLNYELVVDIDWRKFTQSKYLEDVSIRWSKKVDEDTFHFKDMSGTFIQIDELKEEWTRGMARQLMRNTISMLSPKNDKSRFQIKLNFGNNWLADFPDTSQILEKAPYKLSALVDKDYNLTFEYTFQPQQAQGVGNRHISSKSINEIDKFKYERNIKEELRPFYRGLLERKQYDKEIIQSILNNFDFETIPFGSLMLELFSFDLDSSSLRDTTNSPSLIKEMLREHAGIKVFKGDLRVFDYGDPGNDWLGLDLKRIQNKEWFSNNQNIGYVYLDAAESNTLIEKTNREGFVQSETFDHFLVLLEFLLTEFKAERQSDRRRWLLYNKKALHNSLSSQISEFKQLIFDEEIPYSEKQQKLLFQAEKIEERYEEDKNTLLLPASVGMTASFAIHEIEKLVPRMQESVMEDPLNRNKIENQVRELKDYSDGILSILRKGGNKLISVKDAVEQAISNYSSRLKYRKITVRLIIEDETISIYCDRRLFITMVMNLIDNSIYWLDAVFRDEKQILITAKKIDNTVSLIIADNGPGFKDPVDDLVRPFFSRKEGGIGIGLYMIDTVMSQFGKLNIIFHRENTNGFEIPEEFSGAVVELKFSRK